MAPVCALIAGTYVSRANTDVRDELHHANWSNIVKWSFKCVSAAATRTDFIRRRNAGSAVEQQNHTLTACRHAVPNSAQQQCHQGLYVGY